MRRHTLILLSVLVLAALAPAARAAQPAARELMFTDGSSIQFVRADGTGRRRIETPSNGLPTHSYQIHDAGWGPRGRQLVYSKVSCLDLVCEPRTGEIHVVDADGRNDRTVVTIPDGTVSGAQWSPDGRRIAFMTWHWVPCWGCPAATLVHVINPDGTGHVTLGPGHSPEWAPGGGRLAYISGGGVTVADLDLGSPPQVVSPVGLSAGASSWSPDGRSLAFLGNDPVEDGLFLPFQVWVVDADGARPRALPAWSYSRVSWSPDSRQVALAVADGDGIAIADREGRSVRLLDTGPGHVLSVAWSPGGTTIAYRHYLHEQDSIRSVSPLGTSHRILVSDARWASEVTWRP